MRHIRAAAALASLAGLDPAAGLPRPFAMARSNRAAGTRSSCSCLITDPNGCLGFDNQVARQQQASPYVEWPKTCGPIFAYSASHDRARIADACADTYGRCAGHHREGATHPPGHDLAVVTDLSHAKKAIRTGGLSLVFVGARFDDSRMFDLIELVRNELEQKRIPIVAAIITPTTLGKEAVAGLSHAVKIFGASLFINLNDFPDNVVGNARARVIVDTMILPPEAVTRIAAAPLRGPIVKASRAAALCLRSRHGLPARPRVARARRTVVATKKF